MFDLWHDLQQEHERGEVRINNGFRRLIDQSFCWHCRKVISGDADGEPESQGPAKEEDGEEVQAELGFSYVYEV